MHWITYDEMDRALDQLEAKREAEILDRWRASPFYVSPEDVKTVLRSFPTPGTSATNRGGVTMVDLDDVK